MEEPIEEVLGKVAVVGNPLVEFEVGFDHVLESVADYVIKGQPGVFRGVDSNTGYQLSLIHISCREKFLVLHILWLKTPPLQ